MTTADLPASVYVMELTINNEYGFTSVHRTYEGARAALERKVDDFDVRAEYEASEEMTFDQEHGSVACAGEDGDDITYGISRLPVEP